MKHERAQDFVAAGLIGRATIAPYPMGDGWIVTFEVSVAMPSGGTPDLERQRGGVRQFKTLDSAVKVIKQLGLGRVELRLV
jgi:hypothetical protein